MSSAAAKAETVRIGELEVAPGRQGHANLQVARLPTGDWLAMPVTVLNGRRPGPRLWLDAALHGDELNGLEIIRRVLARLRPSRLAGAIVAVPIVNVFGFVQNDRYLPDRRDLNRSFPGSPRGPLASRLAHLFLQEVVERCQYGIDYHTGSLARTNLPQIRADLEDDETRRLAEAFAAPLLYSAPTRPGSLRAAAVRRGVHLLVFEGGEPRRFNQRAIEAGVTGTLRVLEALGMWRDEALPPAGPSFQAAGTRWLRASRSGIFRLEVALGETVARGATLGRISDPFSRRERRVRAPFAGLVMGHTHNPLVYQGDALIHLARSPENGATGDHGAEEQRR